MLGKNYLWEKNHKQTCLPFHKICSIAAMVDDGYEPGGIEKKTELCRLCCPTASEAVLCKKHNWQIWNYNQKLALSVNEQYHRSPSLSFYFSLMFITSKISKKCNSYTLLLALPSTYTWRDLSNHLWVKKRRLPCNWEAERQIAIQKFHCRWFHIQCSADRQACSAYKSIN